MKHPKVLLLAINYWPEIAGIGKYTGEMARWLVQNDVQVRVVTAPPYYPSWHLTPPYSGRRYCHEHEHGVNIWRCPLWVPEKPGGFRRIIHLASFALSSFPVLLWQSWKWRPDLIFVVEPPLFCAPFALISSRLTGAKSWLHVQDFEVDAAFELGILRLRFARKLVLSIERRLYKKFDGVTTISRRMHDRLLEKGIDSKKAGLFPNWVELNRIYPLEGMSTLRKEWGYNEKDVVVLFSGTMGAKHGLEIVIEAAASLSHASFLHFILCGEGVERQRLQKMAGDLSNVSFKPFQSLERFNDLLNLADIHILPQREDVADLVLPSKLTNMLASGRPVVATAKKGTEVWEIVQNKGICVPPGDKEAVVQAIEKLAGDRELRKSLGHNARQFVQHHWSIEKVLGKFISQLPLTPHTEIIK